MIKFLGLNGLRALTDETGVFQHAKYSIVIRKEGYTTDDNARALIAALRYHRVFKDPEALQIAKTYLSFLLYMQKKDGRFHNLLGFDREFNDEVGSEDCIGRALWGCGYTLSACVSEEMKRVAKEVLDHGFPPATVFTSPRAKAFTILGLGHYHRSFPSDQNILKNIERLSEDLIRSYKREADHDWRWFEPYLTYCNPRLPHALFAAYESLGKSKYLEVARNSLDFLIENQIVEDLFIPIGTEGWFMKNGRKALYDQQPIEASCMVEGALAALDSTGDERYRNAALIAFSWYHGKNTKKVVLCNQSEGTCYDGITPKGLNLNQGAEATLSYYLAYLKLKEKNLI